MSHMVIYRTADGQPGYHQTDALDDAVSFVERLRNSDGVDHARIFRMEEVTFDFKPYFKVEVGNEAAMAPTMAPAPAPAPEPAPLIAPFSAPAAAPAPVDEHNWMDLPVVEEPVEAPVVDPFGAPAEPAPVEMASPFGEPAVAPAPEPATPIFETIPPPPPPPPAMEDDAVGSANGMGARRGLFGR